MTAHERLEAQSLSSRRLWLEPLRPEHADEMAPLLDDVALHTFIGGEPATREELRDRYARLAVGRSPDGSQRWLNWIIRRQDTGRPVGTTQATVREEDGMLVADVAWVVASAHQRQGFAREAAGLMVRWLRRQGVDAVVAHVHPRHHASMAVARAVGLSPTDLVEDGEVRWEG